MHWKHVYCFLQAWPSEQPWLCSSLQSPEPRRGSGWRSMLAELRRTYGNKARRQSKLLRIEVRNILKQVKRRRKRRYKQLLKRSKRTSCGKPAESVHCPAYRVMVDRLFNPIARIPLQDGYLRFL